jgi:predicted HicB family RNase H-like nuclease
MADSLLKHRGYTGTVEVDLDNDCLYGKVLFIESLITYQGKTPAAIRKSFAEEVDEYLADCAAMGVDPEKPCSGTFQIRCSPQLHKKLTLQALVSGTSFNQYVVSLLNEQLSDS